jgi:hypothetical protein
VLGYFRFVRSADFEIKMQDQSQQTPQHQLELLEKSFETDFEPLSNVRARSGGAISLGEAKTQLEMLKSLLIKFLG